MAWPPPPRAPTLDLAELSLRARVPTGDPLGARAADVLRSITETELEQALGEACESLVDHDAGAVWVFRELEVHARVPASEMDVRAQLRRISTSFAEALCRALERGPDERAVRFASRAEHVAQFVAARRRGAGASWAFAPFRDLAGVPPLTVLPIACRQADVSPWEVVETLARGGEWRRLVHEATNDELAMIDGALAQLAAPLEPLPEVAASVRLAAANLAAQGDAIGSPVVRRLLTLGHVLVAFGGSAAHAAATWNVTAATDERMIDHPSVRPAPRLPGDAESPPSPSTDPAPLDPEPEPAELASGLFAAPGAVSFMLVSALREVADDLDAPWLAAATPEGVAGREALLAMAIGAGEDVDDAIRVAAGRASAPLIAADDQGEDDEVAPSWASIGDAPEPTVEDRAWLDPDGVAEDGLVCAASCTIRRFLRSLAGFNAAPLSYVMPRVLPRGGVVSCAPELIEVVLPAPPLQVLLQIAGLDAFSCSVPWMDQTIVVSHQEAP